MKYILILLLLIPLIGFSQGRFAKKFQEADSAFNEIVMNETIKSARETDSIFDLKKDSIFYNCIYCFNSNDYKY